MRVFIGQFIASEIATVAISKHVCMVERYVQQNYIRPPIVNFLFPVTRPHGKI